MRGRDDGFRVGPSTAPLAIMGLEAGNMPPMPAIFPDYGAPIARSGRKGR